LSGLPARGEALQRLLIPITVAMLVAPPVAGLVMTAVVDGLAGWRSLGERMMTWRVGAGTYALALLTVPLTALAVLTVLSAFDPAFTPGIFVTDDFVATLLFGLIGGLVAGFIEEIGWTGFALPRMLRARSVLVVGLIVGVLHAVWHLPAG
jgi:membrane protease YdiL (CAAX protease family)